MFSSCKPHSNFRSQPDHNTSKLEHVHAQSLTLAGQLESPAQNYIQDHDNPAHLQFSLVLEL